jgi:hypothetical protein
MARGWFTEEDHGLDSIERNILKSRSPEETKFVEAERARNLGLAQWHAQMRQKYLRAAACPWEPVARCSDATWDEGVECACTSVP